MRSDKNRLLDILEAIERIEKRIPSYKEDFLDDLDCQIVVLHFLQIIGEASANLSENIIERNSDIPWVEIIAFRNLMSMNILASISTLLGIQLKPISRF
jgi:uncharacterized protein with HEPN domain